MKIITSDLQQVHNNRLLTVTVTVSRANAIVTGLVDNVCVIDRLYYRVRTQEQADELAHATMDLCMAIAEGKSLSSPHLKHLLDSRKQPRA